MKTVAPPAAGNNNPGGSSSNNLPPAITPPGTPIGELISQTIGPVGGSLVSDDSVVELKIPAGALLANTDITIQSVTNETPGGIGFSYQLGPDGTRFSAPVTLIFHYTEDQISDPYLLFVAYQDSNYAWQADLKNRDVDTVAKTVSLDIPHFSDWSIGQLGVKPIGPSVLRANEHTDIAAYKVIDGSDPNDLGAAPVPTPFPMEDNKVSKWAVDGKYGGSSDRGTVAPANGNLVTFTAPASIPSRKKVKVSAEYNDVVFTRWNKGKMVFSNKSSTLSTNITLMPSEYKYTVQISYTDYATIYKGQTYYDHVTFDLNIKVKNDHEAEATMPLPAVNYAPTVTPIQMRYTFGTGSWADWTWIPDGIGEINVTGASAFSENGRSYDQEKNSVRILLKHTGCVLPKYDYKDSNGSTKTPGGESIDGLPDTFDIDLTTGTSPTFLPDGSIQVKIIPK